MSDQAFGVGCLVLLCDFSEDGGFVEFIQGGLEVEFLNERSERF
jgi:hypothetical protein